METPWARSIVRFDGFTHSYLRRPSEDIRRKLRFQDVPYGFRRGSNGSASAKPGYRAQYRYYNSPVVAIIAFYAICMRGDYSQPSLHRGEDCHLAYGGDALFFGIPTPLIRPVVNLLPNWTVSVTMPEDISDVSLADCSMA